MMYKKILSDTDRYKIDNSDDQQFYLKPRFVHHLDIGFRRTLTKLYKKLIPNNSVVLDLMSSWTSHLPNNKVYKKVIGHGLNKSELESNTMLNSFWIQDLNKLQVLPLESSSVDVVLISAGWQYLIYPESLAFELKRILKRNGLVIVSFSNRAFWQKTPRIWNMSDHHGQIKYISDVLIYAGLLIQDSIIELDTNHSVLDFLGIKGDPFFSVVGSNH